MVWLVLSIILLTLIGIIALTRVRILIDSYNHEAKLSWGRVVWCRLTQINGYPIACLYILGWTRNWNILELIARKSTRSARQPEPQAGSSEKKRKKRGYRRIGLRKALKLIRSFKVEEFKAELDTDDFVMNAWLWPVIELLRYNGADIRVNFDGVNEIKLNITNSPIRVLIAWLK